MIILFASCFRSDSPNNNLEYESQAADSFAADTIYSEITEDFTNEDTINVYTAELNENNNEWKSDFQYLIPLKEYLIKLKDDDTLLLYYPNLVINLFDYDNDGNSDALVSEGTFNGTLSYQ